MSAHRCDPTCPSSHFTIEEVDALLDLAPPQRGMSPHLVVVDELVNAVDSTAGLRLAAAPVDDAFDGGAAGRGGKPRPRRKPESEIVLAGINYLRSLPNGYARKVHGGSMGNTGEPDVDACVDGRSVKLEAKAGSNTPSTTQLAAMRRWARAGALVGWFTATEHIRQLLDHLNDLEYTNDLSAPGCARPCHRETA